MGILAGFNGFMADGKARDGMEVLISAEDFLH